MATDKAECIVCMACVKICPVEARVAHPKNAIVKSGLRNINRHKHESQFVVLMDDDL